MNTQLIKTITQLIIQIGHDIKTQLNNGDRSSATTNKYRLKTFLYALDVIKSFKTKIISASELDGIKGIGPGVKGRINEILKTGTLLELDKDKVKEKKIKLLDELNTIIGIGPMLANTLVDVYEIKSIAQLKKKIEKNKIQVSDTVKLGLKYYGLIKRNIPRKEIESIENILKKELTKLSPNMGLYICGSYRRGKSTSGDIDVLIYHKAAKTKEHITDYKKYNLKPYLELYVDLLIKKKLLLDTISLGKDSFMGLCQYKNNPIRRIDIKYTPYYSLGATLLHFTGPYELNIEMSTIAKKMNMKLNKYGLYKVHASGKSELIAIKTEEDIFKILGIKYLTPEEREKYSK